MLARDTKIYKDSYNLARKVFDVTRTMKSEYRSSIARRLEELSIVISMKIVEALSGCYFISASPLGS